MTSLTTRELQLITTLKDHLGNPVSKYDLGNQIFGYWDKYAARNLLVIVSHTRTKLGYDSIETIHGVGYKLGRKMPLDSLPAP